MSSVLDKYILYKHQGGAIRAIPAITDPCSSQSSANSRPLAFVQNEKNEPESAKPRHAYSFRLKNNGGGGTYLTDESDLDAARYALIERYGASLLLVTKAGTET